MFTDNNFLCSPAAGVFPPLLSGQNKKNGSKQVMNHQNVSSERCRSLKETLFCCRERDKWLETPLWTEGLPLAGSHLCGITLHPVLRNKIDNSELLQSASSDCGFDYTALYQIMPTWWLNSDVVTVKFCYILLLYAVWAQLNYKKNKLYTSVVGLWVPGFCFDGITLMSH